MVSAVCMYGPKDVLVPFVFGVWKIVQLESPSNLVVLGDKNDCAVYVASRELENTGVDYRERKATKLWFVFVRRLIVDDVWMLCAFGG